jgi:D-beta-D-heptose 7-phosphate kinase / D-beta-D-heptose 1-phosphate adenosyltransferase
MHPRRVTDVVDAWQGLPVLVLGDVLLDEWWHGDSDRLCREAPVAVVSVGRTEYAPGGAANAAVNIAALGGRPTLVAGVGDDEAGGMLCERLSEWGVDFRPVVAPGWRTPTKRRVVAGDQIVVRLDDERRVLPGGARRAVLAGAKAALSERPAAVTLCDYGYGTLDGPARRWLVARRPRLPVVTLDAHALGAWAELHPTLVTPSYEEALGLLGDLAGDGTGDGAGDRPGDGAGNGTGDGAGNGSGDRAAAVEDRAAALLERMGARAAAVTLDADGAVVVAPGTDPVRTDGKRAPASHTVGAGDAYLAALTLASAAGADLTDGARLAQLAAGAAITGPCTCVCGRDALIAELALDPAARVCDPATLLERIESERAGGARVVFTNGCFDVLHRGHVGLLQQARELGDLLVVAVNSDASVARLKGADRPVNHVEDRTALLAALTCVDYVVVFDDDSPAELIERLRPDVYVKGGDYRPELLSEAALVQRLGGQVRILEYVPDRSTSAIIERIRSRRAGAAR